MIYILLVNRRWSQPLNEKKIYCFFKFPVNPGLIVNKKLQFFWLLPNLSRTTAKMLDASVDYIPNTLRHVSIFKFVNSKIITSSRVSFDNLPAEKNTPFQGSDFMKWVQWSSISFTFWWFNFSIRPWESERKSQKDSKKKGMDEEMLTLSLWILKENH